MERKRKYFIRDNTVIFNIIEKKKFNNSNFQCREYKVRADQSRHRRNEAFERKVQRFQRKSCNAIKIKKKKNWNKIKLTLARSPWN